MREGLAGIFVGGRGLRMGERPKGLLRPPGSDEPIVRRLATLATQAGLRVVLVGAHEAYAGLGLPLLPDDPPGHGPIGGLAALLAHAGDAVVVTLACDLPHVDEALLAALLAAPPAPAVAPRIDDRWQPFFARYEPGRVLPVVRRALELNRHSLQGVLDACAAVPLDLGGRSEALRDWDTPDDVARDGGRLD